jgi:hypothetical protein
MSGKAAVFQRTGAAVTGSYVLSGKAAVFQRKGAAVKGTYTLTGVTTRFREPARRLRGRTSSRVMRPASIRSQARCGSWQLCFVR